MAKNSKSFESSIGVPVGDVKVEVVLSEELAWRANNLPKDRRDRGSSRGLNDGFAGNGFYGEKDLDRLVDRLEKKMIKRLEKEGVEVDETSTNVLRLTLADVSPNRPTFEQQSRNSRLSFSSIGLGGASFEGTLISENGESEADISYAWYESSFCGVPTGGTWTDTNRAIDRFAKKTAKAVAWD